MPQDESRVAIVTGSSRGIGRAIALALAAAGRRVVVNCRESRVAAEKVLAMVEELFPGGGLFVQADVSREEGAAALVAQTVRRFGRLDILVNNAGISDPRPFLDIGPAEWDRMLRANLTSAFHCSRAALPHMLAGRWGRIINISSTSGITGGTSGAHYASAKGGMIALTKALAAEVASMGVTVNSILPSKIETDMLREAVGEAGLEAVASKIPVGRLGKPEEIASLAVYLASEQSGYITGEAITASGGYR